MTIELLELMTNENKAEEVQVSVGLSSFSSRLGDFPIVRTSPMDLRIENRENKRLLLRGSVNLTVMIPCGRCLKDVSTELSIPVEKELFIEDSTVRDDDMDETDYITGTRLDTDRLVYGELLMNWPANVLCRPDCKGICKKCGKNLNEGECGCDKAEPDPRMAAIQDIFNQFKEG